MSVSKNGDFKPRVGVPFEHFHYDSLTEAEGVSRDIGFPPFCCTWLSDGSFCIGGGGGTKGTGVRSALLFSRLIDGSAARKGSMVEALIDPEDIVSGSWEVPQDPQIQVQSELNTDDDIVFSICEHSEGNHALFACSIGMFTCVFESKGVGSLASSTLPPCLPPGVVDQNVAKTVECNIQAPVVPLTPFRSPLLAQMNKRGLSQSSVMSQLAKDGVRNFELKYKFRTDFTVAERNMPFGSQLTCEFAYNGRVVVTGSSDGGIRAFYQNDMDCNSTLYGTTMMTPQTPKRHGTYGATAPSCVSPKCVVIGQVDGEVLTLSVSKDSKYVVVSTDAQLSMVFEQPPQSAFERATGIPVDFYDEHGVAVPYDESLAEQSKKNGALAWISRHPAHSTGLLIQIDAPATAHKSVFVQSSLVPTNEHHILTSVNLGRNKGCFIVLYKLIGGKIHASTSCRVHAKNNITQFVLSRDQAFIAVATNEDFCIYATAYNSTGVKPFTMLAERKKVFDMPCTSISFDPTNRLAVAVCASRAVVFLSTTSHRVLKNPKHAPKTKPTCCQTLGDVLLNSLIIIFILIIVAKYNEFSNQITYKRYS